MSALIVCFSSCFNEKSGQSDVVLAVPDKDKSCGRGCTFVDAASGHIEVEFQTFFSAQETVDAIRRHEQKARDKGIAIQECQFDNGLSFTSRSLKDCLLEQGQTC